MDADQLGGLALAQALPLDQEQGPAPQLLLRRPTDAAKVACFHPDAIAPAPRAVRYGCGRLVGMSANSRSSLLAEGEVGLERPIWSPLPRLRPPP